MLQFQKVIMQIDSTGKKQVENLHTIFLSDSILLVYYRYKQRHPEGRCYTPFYPKPNLR